jgi:uncharacterized protein (TIGR02001 family)
MSRALFIAAACAMAATAAPTAAAQPSWGGSVTLASDHMVRGISRSDNQPSLSGELHLQAGPGLFAALWAATSRPDGSSTTVDVSATLGLGGRAGRDAGWRLAWSHYQSPWQRNSGWYRYNEITADLQLRDALLLSVNWSPDTYVYSAYTGVAARIDAAAYELSFQQHFPAGWRGHGGAGFRDFMGGAGGSYWYGSLGLGWVGRHWESDVSYVHSGEGADEMSWPGTARSTVLLRLTYSF